MQSPELAPPAPLQPDVASHWMLRGDIAFLNHGSFGSTPRVVFDEQDRWRRRIEAEPVELLGRQCLKLLDEAKAKVGAYLGMPASDFGFVTNATEGINAVLRSLEPTINPGDELVTTTHVYNAVRQAMKYVAQRRGAKYVEVDVKLPVRSPDDIARPVLGALTPRTKLVLVDHVTSATALVFPVETIIGECAKRGVDVIVDGAHAPGMVPLNVEQLGAAYYAGNLHKWTCGPKGAGFIHVRKDRQAAVHPNVVSHFLGQGIVKEFGWQGTRDISAWLAVPKAIEFMSSLGWERVMRHNHALATWAHQRLVKKWNVEPISPLDGSLLGSMATMRLPGKLSKMSEDETAVVQQRLYSEHGVEAPLFPFAGEVMLRVACQVYNRPDHIERLGEAVLRLAR